MTQGYLGGFSGRLGTAIGYMWNGKWCLRSRPAVVANPRTPAQVEHRTLFREEVRLAARMGRGVSVGFTAMARQMGMTCFNLFVSLNQPAFALRDNQLEVDYGALRLSSGPVAPVAFGKASVDENNVLSVEFEKNPLHLRAEGYDRVMVYVYCPEAGGGYLSAPVYRRDKRLSFTLPDEFAGLELHLYGIVQDDEGRCAESAYIEIGQQAEGMLSPMSEAIDGSQDEADQLQAMPDSHGVHIYAGQGEASSGGKSANRST